MNSSFKTMDEKTQISIGHPKIYFLKGGKFVIGWKESEYATNKFFRRREKTPEHLVKFTGSWKLEYRPPMPAERTALGIEKRLKFSAYFLGLSFENNKLPEGYEDYPELEEVKVNGQMLLTLNEFQPYQRDKRSKPSFTTPDNLLWILLDSNMDAFLMPSTVASNRLLIMRHR